MTEWMLEKYGPFMDVGELAEVLKIKKTTLYNQLYADKVDLPYVKRGKKYLFPTTEVVSQMQAALRTQSTEI
jgi:excisionase family DNA binding protein